MNRLQKKCVIATAGIHLLLLIILIFGPGFFNRQPKNDDNQVLTFIPANLVDAAINSGVQNATPPPPTPVTPLPPQPVQPPPQPAPRIVQPPAPAPVPSPETLTEKLKDLFRSLNSEPTPTATPPPKPAKPQPDNIQINTQLVKRTAPKTDKAQNQQQINKTLKSLSKNLSSSTTVDVPGNASAAYANYGNVVTSVYHSVWVPPDGMASDNATVEFKVTISRDGTVISARIVKNSSDPNVDAAVQRMLDRVTFIAPFPEGSDDKERTYSIEFNATHASE